MNRRSFLTAAAGGALSTAGLLMPGKRIGLQSAMGTAVCAPTPSYTADRFVYLFGDPLAANSGFPNTNLAPLDSTTKNWTRQADATIVTTRIVYDDTAGMPVLAPGGHSIRCEIQPSDPGFSGANNQRAHIGANLDSMRAYTGEPSQGMIEGQTHWYGLPWKTNAAFVPQFDINQGNWNILWGFHGSQGVQAPINTELTTIKVLADNREFWTYAPGTMTQISPIFAVAITGGNIDDPNWAQKDGQGTPGVSGTTNRVYPIYDLPFVAGTLYKLAYKITWGSKLNGSVEVYIDKGDGNGLVRKINAQGVCNQWYSAALGVDNSMFILAENYRYCSTPGANSGLPLSQFYYSGYIKGGSMYDVTIP